MSIGALLFIRRDEKFFVSLPEAMPPIDIQYRVCVLFIVEREEALYFRSFVSLNRLLF